MITLQKKILFLKHRLANLSKAEGKKDFNLSINDFVWILKVTQRKCSEHAPPQRERFAIKKIEKWRRY